MYNHIFYYCNGVRYIYMKLSTYVIPGNFISLIKNEKSISTTFEWYHRVGGVDNWWFGIYAKYTTMKILIQNKYMKNYNRKKTVWTLIFYFSLKVLNNLKLLSALVVTYHNNCIPSLSLWKWFHRKNCT
jgi:hypothetical protein